MYVVLFLAVISGISAIDCPVCSDQYDVTTCSGSQSCPAGTHDACELQVHLHDNNRIEFDCFNSHACTNHEVHHCNPSNDQTCSFCCNSFDDCQQQLQVMFNSIFTTTTTQAPTTTSMHCLTEGDIVLILDDSGSIGIDNYNTMLQFVANLTANFNIGPTGVQFGGITFSTTAQRIFDLNTYADHASLEQGILGAAYAGGSTYTHLALDIALQESFQTQYGARAGVPKIAIVFTDGQSTDSAATIQSADNLKNSGVSVMAIGVGSGVSTAELQSIASSSNDVYQVAGFDVLDSIEHQIANNTCTISGTGRK